MGKPCVLSECEFAKENIGKDSLNVLRAVLCPEATVIKNRMLQELGAPPVRCVFEEVSNSTQAIEGEAVHAAQEN